MMVCRVRILAPGGYAFHGPFEHITAEGMDVAVQIVLGIIEKYAKRKDKKGAWQECITCENVEKKEVTSSHRCDMWKKGRKTITHGVI